MSDRQNLSRPAPEATEDAGDAYLDQQILEPGALGDDEPPGMNDDPDPGYVDHEREARS